MCTPLLTQAKKGLKLMCSVRRHLLDYILIDPYYTVCCGARKGGASLLAYMHTKTCVAESAHRI